MSRGDLVFMGPPGSGKGTQAKSLVRSLGYVQLSTGDLFRDKVDRNTDLGRQVRQYLEKGAYVPDEITVQMVRERLAEIPDEQSIVFDGFPRTEAQATALDQILDEIGRRVDAVILLDVPKEEIINRLLKRGAEQGRSDDMPDLVGKRYDAYERQTKPLIDFYERDGRLRRVDGLGDVDEIAARLREAAIRPEVIE